jgi:hypothetical protein
LWRKVKTVVSELTWTGWMELGPVAKSIITWAESLSAQEIPLPPICQKEISAATPVAQTQDRERVHALTIRLISTLLGINFSMIGFINTIL